MSSKHRNIKHVCDKCNKIETYSKGEMFTKFVFDFFTFLGIIFFVVLFVVGPVFMMNLFSSSLLTMDARRNSDELRSIALNHTTYDGYDSFEFAKDLMGNLPRIRYALPSVWTMKHSVEETWETKTGECKQQSILFTGLMLSMGYIATVDCDLNNNHCVSRIPHQNQHVVRDEYMVVDLTTEIIRVYPNDVNFWKTPDNYLEEHDYYYVNQQRENEE